MHPGQKVPKSQLITLLNSLEVNIEADTKRTVADLDITLDKALDGCQSIYDIPNLLGKDGLVDIDSFPKRTTAPGQRVAVEMIRNTIVEAVEGFRDGDAKTLRQLVWYLGSRFDEGKGSTYLMDTEGVSAICIRILEVRNVAVKTPLLLVLYDHDMEGDDTKSPKGLWDMSVTADNLNEIFEAGLSQQHLLLRLLKLNAKRVPPSLRHPRAPADKSFKVSFILPVGPLSPDCLNDLSNEAPNFCALCSLPAKALCGSCRAVRYCTREHQKQHWKIHKSQCSNLAGAEWITLPFNTGSASASMGRFTSTINFRTVLQGPNNPFDGGSRTYDAGDGPPPNAHGSRPFLIKIQMPMGMERPVSLALPALVYDQSRDFHVTVDRPQCPPTTWDRLLKACAAAGIAKVYVWARRTADYELSIAIDRLPDQRKIPW